MNISAISALQFFSAIVKKGCIWLANYKSPSIYRIYQGDASKVKVTSFFVREPEYRNCLVRSKGGQKNDWYKTEGH
jgi:hypothetical protein